MVYVACVTEDREDYKVTKEHLDGQKMFKHMKREYFIRNFAGIRWKRYNPETGEILDFMLESDEKNPNTVNLVGIESPGITCALPFAKRAVKRRRLRLQKIRIMEKWYQEPDSCNDGTLSGRLHVYRKGKGRRMRQTDVVIIGGGPAGLATAVRLWEKGIRDILILEREYFLGGILR